MSKFLPKSSYLAFALLCIYAVALTCYDSYIFETVLLLETWIKTRQNVGSIRLQHQVFHLNESKLQNIKASGMPLILIWYPMFGAVNFNENLCPGCLQTYDRKVAAHAAAIVFHCAETRDSRAGLPWKQRKLSQRWVWKCMEPPWNVRHVFQKTLTPLNGVFNWTMTYRTDSDVLSSYVIDYPPIDSIDEVLAKKNSSLIAAWVVSNCHVTIRNEFVENIREYMRVDQFGKCSGNALDDDGLISRYKFYFSLENSLCKDYITEKFWYKALGSGSVPVVMGPPKADYELIAPPGSFIHVDDFANVKDLAEYLNMLNQNDKLYAEYLRWRTDSTWKKKVTDTKATALRESKTRGNANGLCALCQKLLHSENSPPDVVTNLDQWWYGEGYSPHRDHLPVCSAKSGPSGFPMKWVVTYGYSALFFLVIFLVLRGSRKRNFFKTP